jgi:hypothetical protein
MRFGSRLHSFDGDQRLVSVPILHSVATLIATGHPGGAAGASSRSYILWLLDVEDFPCQHAGTVGRIALKSVPVLVFGKDNASGQIKGKEVGVKMRKPAERDKFGGGWGLGMCGTKAEK